MSIIQLNGGVILHSIPSSPNSDYMAGNDGNIYSRTRYKGFGRKEFVEWYPLAGHRSPKGYLRVSMCHENVKVTRSVHRLICEAWHGRPMPTTLQSRHLDSDPANNLPSNLAWATQAENWQDRRALGRGIGENHHAAKLTNEERVHLRWAVSRGLCSQRHAAAALGMSQGSISAICSSTK